MLYVFFLNLDFSVKAQPCFQIFFGNINESVSTIFSFWSQKAYSAYKYINIYIYLGILLLFGAQFLGSNSNWFLISHLSRLCPVLQTKSFYFMFYFLMLWR